MIAARDFRDFGRGLGRNAFDLPVAALAGLAAAILAFAMPADLLSQAVDATGLPSILAAAEPPLGFKARAAFGIAGALAAFAIVFLLLRRLGAGAAGKAKPGAAAEEGMPKLRRRDVHPDAPARRMISAARDLGEPAPPVQPAAKAATPVWLAEADIAQPEPEPEPELEPEPEPEPEQAPAPVAQASLAELMERLERGLARRRPPQVFAPATQPPHMPAPQVFPAGDDRLQSAIEGLQRLAARGD